MKTSVMLMWITTHSVLYGTALWASPDNPDSKIVTFMLAWCPHDCVHIPVREHMGTCVQEVRVTDMH